MSISEKYYVQDTIKHRMLVQKEMSIIINNIQQRLIHHDADKILNNLIYDAYSPVVIKLRKTKYDSSEYHELLAEMDVGWTEHIKN